MFLFGFLGPTGYAFTSFAQRFDEDERYRLKIVSRTVAGLVSLAGIYVSATLEALGGLAERLLGVGTTDADVRGKREGAPGVPIAAVAVSGRDNRGRLVDGYEPGRRRRPRPSTAHRAGTRLRRRARPVAVST